MTVETVSVVLLALLAQAQPIVPVPQDKAKALELLGEGATLYEKGDYTSALDRFQAAYAAFPSPKIWFNIGQANRDLGRPVEALEAFQSFLGGAVDASPEDKADAQTAVIELQKKLGQLTIACEAAGAVLSLDGKALGPAPLAQPVWAVPGTHQVTAIAQGAAPVVESAMVTAGASTTVVLRIGPPLVSAPPPAPLAAVVAPPPVEVVALSPPPEPARGWWLGRKWTWVAAGSTVVLTGVAVGLGLHVSSRFDELDRSCGASGTGQGCSEDDLSSLRTRRNITNALWAAAGAAAVTTGVLFFVEGRRVAVMPVAGETTGMVAWIGF